MLIGFGHAARVGKNTAVDILVKRHNFIPLSFAAAIKKIAYEIRPDVRMAMDLYGWERAKFEYPPTRECQIALGNSGRTHLGPNVWTEAIFNQMVEGKHYAISDVRYANEVATIQSRGGLAVKIERLGITPLKDVCDQALADFDGWDHVVLNNGTRNDLAEKLARLVEETA